MGRPKGQSTLISAAEGFHPKDGNLACCQNRPALAVRIPNNVAGINPI
jgi:hypothetical protein